MPRVLFIAAHRPGRSPSQRFRFEQYIPFLEKNGFTCHLSYLFSERDDRKFYRPGNLYSKTYILLKSIYRRLRDGFNASGYDVIFIQREAFMTGSVFFEKQFRKSGAAIIFDFDDAIWLLDISDANKKWDWLKRPEKTSELAKLADLVIAGNDYLAAYALSFNKNTIVIPTTVDTDEYSPSPRKKDERICIGWSGSITTIKHFEHAVPVLKRIKEKYGTKIYFTVMGDESYENPELGIKGLPWNRQAEIQALQSFDIGIMPLPNDEWAKGKCGLKGLTYMAVGIPPVMSTVGVNTEIIRHGENGFLASTEEEWFSCLSSLIDSPELRQEMGKEARKTVVEKYSVHANREKYLDCFRQVLSRKQEMITFADQPSIR